jgi:hypothetical protein
MVEINDITIASGKRNSPNKVNFTDRFLQAIMPAPAGKSVTYWDAHTANFGVRVTKNVKSFIVVCRQKGYRRPIKITIGRYDDWSLAEAREKANEVRRDLRRGINPREEEKKRLEEQRLTELRKAEHTFKAVAERYMREHARLRSAKFTALVINRDLIPRWGSLPVTSVTRKHVTAMLHDIKSDAGRRRKAAASATPPARHCRPRPACFRGRLPATCTAWSTRRPTTCRRAGSSARRSRVAGPLATPSFACFGKSAAT